MRRAGRDPEHKVPKIKNRARIARIAGVVVAGGSLAIAVAGIGSAATQYVPLHQATPITAAGFSRHEAQCAAIPSTEDGWAFVLPGHSAFFVSLTVTFKPGGTKRVTTFSPPSDNHAYVGSAPGAVLDSASAIIRTQHRARQVPSFYLSYTCLAATPTPSGSPTVTPSGSPTVTPSDSPTVTPSGSPTVKPSGSPTVKPSGSPTVKPSGSPTVKPSGSPTVAPTKSATSSSASPSPSPTSAARAAPAPTPVRTDLPVTG
jgi:hypothetical protein